jgi:hypothetical protein
MEVGMEERRRKSKWGSVKRKKVVEKEGRDWREEEEESVECLLVPLVAGRNFPFEILVFLWRHF